MVLDTTLFLRILDTMCILAHLYLYLAQCAVFRDFVRLGAPLCCDDDDEEANKSQQCSVIPLTRVKCLVSMTTPRDVRLHGTTITPSFVEFDMSSEGFGCLYLSSIAPQGAGTPSVVTAGMIGGTDMGVVSGIGMGKILALVLSAVSGSILVCIPI